jgi:hypothetical protein
MTFQPTGTGILQVILVVIFLAVFWWLARTGRNSKRCRRCWGVGQLKFSATCGKCHGTGARLRSTWPYFGRSRQQSIKFGPLDVPPGATILETTLKYTPDGIERTENEWDDYRRHWWRIKRVAGRIRHVEPLVDETMPPPSSAPHLPRDSRRRR